MLRSFINQISSLRQSKGLGLRIGLAVMVGLVLTAQVNAVSLPVYTSGLQPGNTDTQGGGDYSVGGAFKYTGSGDAITALGLWDQDQNGLASPHDVGLWDDVGNLLASVTVPAGTSGALVGEYRYVNLSLPVALSTGATYVLGANMNGGDSIINSNGNYPVSYAAPFTYLPFGTGTYGLPGSAEPTIDPNTGFEPFAFGVPYLGPNALFAPVPEPSSIVLAMIGSVAAVWFCKKRRSA